LRGTTCAHPYCQSVSFAMLVPRKMQLRIECEHPNAQATPEGPLGARKTTAARVVAAWAKEQVS